MSKVVKTTLGRFRGVTGDGRNRWLWECPDCKTWGNLSAEQWDGLISVYCTAPVRSYYESEPDATKPCGYHQTHNFARELAVTIQTRLLFGENPFEAQALHDAVQALKAEGCK